MTIPIPDDAAPVVVADEIDNAPDEVTVEGDTTVVVETPSDVAASGDAVDAVVIDNALDTAERLARIETRLDAVESTAFFAQIDAEIALDATEALAEADAEIIEATDEAIVETIEDAEIEDVDKDGEDEIVVDEIAPVSSRVHPMFRSWADWKNRK